MLHADALQQLRSEAASAEKELQELRSGMDSKLAAANQRTDSAEQTNEELRTALQHLQQELQQARQETQAAQHAAADAWVRQATAVHALLPCCNLSRS